MPRKGEPQVSNREAAPPLLHLSVEVRLDTRLNAMGAVGETPVLRHASAVARCLGGVVRGLILGDARMARHPCEANSASTRQGVEDEESCPANGRGGGEARRDGQDGGLGVGRQT